MKNRLLIFVASMMAAFPAAFSAQPTPARASSTDGASDDYKPFVEAGKTWRYKLVDDYIPIPEDPEPLPDDILCISIGDVLEIDGEDWNPIYMRRGGMNSDAAEPFGYVKEDVANRQVLWKDNENAPSVYTDFYMIVVKPHSDIFYDFNDPNITDAIYMPEQYKPGHIEAEGVRYNGFIGELAYVERLGLVERLDTESYGISTIFGEIELTTGWGNHEYRPYIYEVTDGEGNILYQRPENRPSASLSDEKADAMAVTVVNEKVSFSGAAGCPLEIANMHGMVVWRGSTDSAGRALSPSLSKGAYVAKHGARAIKLIVK